MAYENVKFVDCLDLTPEGNACWEAAVKRCIREGGVFVSFDLLPALSRYDDNIDCIETGIAAQLHHQLGRAKRATEMIRIFSHYNALFERARIRGAIREYQTQLIQCVKNDIEKLHNVFKVEERCYDVAHFTCGILFDMYTDEVQ